MISFNHGNTLHRRMVEEHGFNAKQANGTLMIVDEMVDTGVDRVVASIAGLESKMDKRIDDLESKMDKSFATLHSDMNALSLAVDKSLNHMSTWLPIKSVLYTLGGIAVIVGIMAGLVQIIEFFK